MHRSRPPRTPAPRPAAASLSRSLLLALAAVLALRLAAPLLGSNWLWGVDLLRYWPAPLALVLAAVSIAGFFPPVSRRIAAAIERLGRGWERGGRLADVAASLAVALALFALRDPLRFTGDFDLRISSIDFPQPPARLYPQASPLDVLLNLHLTRALLGTGLTPELALRAVGAAVGGAFVLASLATLRAVGASAGAFVAAALLLLGGGYVQHFAGYDKFGPLLLGVALAALGVVRLWRGSGGAWTLACGAALCLLAHRAGFLALPAAAWAYAAGWRAERVARRRTQVLRAAGALSVLVLVLLPRMLQVVLGVDWNVHLPGGAVAQSYQSPDAPGILIRVSDLLNALFFHAPLWPLAVAAAFAGSAGEERHAPGLREGRRAEGREAPPRSRRFSLAMVSALALGAQAALLLAVGIPRGSGRDWDVTTAFGALAALVTAGVLALAWTRTRGAALAPVVTVAAALSVAQWGPHVSEAMGLARARALLEGRPSWSDAARAHARDFLGLRAYTAGRYQESAEEFERAIAAAPNPRFFYQLGLARLGVGSLEAAREAFVRSAALAPAVGDPWVGLARVALARRDTLAAAASLDSALARNPADGDARALRQALAASRAAR